MLVIATILIHHAVSYIYRTVSGVIHNEQDEQERVAREPMPHTNKPEEAGPNQHEEEEPDQPEEEEPERSHNEAPKKEADPKYVAFLRRGELLRRCQRDVADVNQRTRGLQSWQILQSSLEVARRRTTQMHSRESLFWETLTDLTPEPFDPSRLGKIATLNYMSRITFKK